jgi:hypothetical protein
MDSMEGERYGADGLAGVSPGVIGGAMLERLPKCNVCLCDSCRSHSKEVNCLARCEGCNRKRGVIVDCPSFRPLGG